jgi:uncharacterized protein (TIGR00255 family)
MILSMTGFGKAQFSFDSHQTTIEIKSLNSKQLEVNLRLPAAYREKEQELRGTIAREIGRGKVDCFVNIENISSSNVFINEQVLSDYFYQLKAISNQLQPETSTDIFSIAARMPDVAATNKEDLSQEEAELLLSALEEAIRQLIAFRTHEGDILKIEILSHIHQIDALLISINPFESIRVSQLRERIEKNISELTSTIQVDQNRLEQEMIFYIEKLDITEEKVRLKKHLDYFINAINDEVSNGKKLGFVSQEIGREINTIGSKANCFEIQQIVVQMKDELEKIKEQLLNIL